MLPAEQVRPEIHDEGVPIRGVRLLNPSYLWHQHLIRASKSHSLAQVMLGLYNEYSIENLNDEKKRIIPNADGYGKIP